MRRAEQQIFGAFQLAELILRNPLEVGSARARLGQVVLPRHPEQARPGLGDAAKITSDPAE